MRVVDPGHRYALDQLDLASRPDHEITDSAVLQFVKRVGDHYPGNTSPSCSGTTTQEVLRALIDRTKYVDGQRPHVDNLLVLRLLRDALRLLEHRAALERDDKKSAFAIMSSSVLDEIETIETCTTCGHVMCVRTSEEHRR